MTKYEAMAPVELRRAWAAGDREGDLEEALAATDPALWAAYVCWRAASVVERELNTPEAPDLMDELLADEVPMPVSDRVRGIYEAHLEALTGVPPVATVITQGEARAALVEATRVREQAEPAWRQAILAAHAAGVGPTEIARLAHVTRGRIYQILPTP
jgi:hypothetical protein